MIERPMYVDKIMAYVDTPFVKILTGVRRCGKSTILKMIMERLKSEHNIPENRILSYRFDSMEYDGATAKQIYDELKSRLSTDGKTYLFLDEIQEIQGWEKVVNSLASDFDVDIYVTGSNSRMMSSEISTYHGQVYCFQNIHAFLCGISDIQADIQCCRTPPRGAWQLHQTWRISCNSLAGVFAGRGLHYRPGYL